jgi:hypothetical protein
MTTPVHTPARSLEQFLAGILDYAGLFPPAGLAMRECVDNYALYLAAPGRWALGRFVLPVARLNEFLNAQQNSAGDPWRLAGTLGADVEGELRAVEDFNRKAMGAVMDCVELRVSSVAEIDRARALLPAGVDAFFEVAPERAASLLPHLAQVGARAKLRTGGVTAESFPEIKCVADFLLRAFAQRVPFKATAGLHHPLRCARALTYEPESPTGTMHGFLNLFTAAAIALTGGQREVVERCLADGDATNWHFGNRAMTWNGGDEPMQFNLAVLRRLRGSFALSFGSCSFVEPLGELREMKLL